MTNEIDLTVDTQTVIDALEDTGDYKVFEDNTDGIAEATEWMQEHDCVIYSDTDEAITKIIENETASYILDRLRPDEVIPYAWDIYLNKTMDDLIDNKHKQLDMRCDDLIQAIIQHKGVDYVLDQVGLDSRVTRAVTTDYHYVVDALVERRSMYIAESDQHAMTHLFWKMIHSKDHLIELGVNMEDNCSDEEIDALLGPIYSDKIIRHLEDSIDALVIHKKEEPTNELSEIFLTYLDEFDWRSTFIKLMRRHGVMLETILRSYIEDERAEESEANGY